jgi:hypothetical protein
MWYETALQQLGVEKDIDLEIAIVPHTEDPDKAVRQMRAALASFGKQD